MSAPEMTKDLLVDAGGWPELKKARSLHEDGAVAEASYENGTLSGQVRVGGKLKKVRMVIRSHTDIENFCTCLMVRRDGRICAHALALGLEILSPAKKAEPQEKATPTIDKWPKITPDAEEISLSVMLPLKMEPAWERGQLMLGFGVKKGGEESLLSHLIANDEFSLAEKDEELWRVLHEIFPTDPPGVVTLPAADFLEILPALIGHDEVYFGKKNRAHIHSRPQKRAQLKLTGERLRVAWPQLGTILAKDGNAWQLDSTDFSPLALGLPKRWWPLLEGGLVVAAEDLRQAFSFLGQWFEIEPDLWLKLPEIRQPEIIIELEGSLRHLEAKPVFKYGKHRVTAGSARLLEENGVRFLTDELAESQVLNFLAEWGFAEGKRGTLQVTEREDILQFHAYGLEELKNRWPVSLGERFRAAAAQIVPVQPRFEMKGSGEDWFAVSLDYQVGGETLPRAEIQRLLRMGQVEKPFGRGKIAVFNPARLEEVAAVLSDCEPLQNQAGIFQVNRRLAAYLRGAAQELGVQAEDWPQENLTPLGDRLGNLQKTLRPYQQEGVEWLWKLSELGMGGILADDMGLGKTLQTLAFLKARGGKALVVCPSSLVENWVAEAQKFVPELSVAAIHGPQRAQIREENAHANLWITSYALLRLDAAELTARGFDLVVLDEAQRIKNPDSQVAKAAFSLNATHRLALTGTPLENSVLDLWSIMNFVLPGYLGGRKAFSERFEKPMRAGDSSLARRLALKMKPVMKRRLKREVAKDLPERIELVRYCEPSKKQREVYQRLLQESRTQVQAADGGKKRMVALTALLRLRQASCDLRLLPGIKVADDEAGAKLAALEELLEEAIANGHRILVFSQFVQLLQAVVPILAERNWNFCYLDGQTKKRGEVVSRFQENDDIPVFLISLKAGGVGLNLTAADTVIHLDPWWNPAVEAQATDRAHRIGQERVVTSYKLITKGTVEEKILALQERKKGLIADTLGEEITSTNALAEDELAGLFED